LAQIARLCLTGPECTGKSTLAALLAREYGTVWVPEYAREYAIALGNTLTAADVEPIARGQIELTDRAPAHAILDTDLISTVVYSRHYYGACPTWIEDEARRRRADLYLLLDTDCEWLPHPARSPTSDDREDLFDAFRAALDEFDTRWQIVSGDWDERYQQALAAASGHDSRG
jgi:NadR type nicotinamide-nucleotide adenylyltransferase